MTGMTGSTEVKLTSRASARVAKIVVSVSLTAAVVAAVASFITMPEWWMILIWVLVALVMLVLCVSVWGSMSDDVRATERLRETGVVTRADVLSGARIDEDDEIRYDLTLEIRPVGSEPFTVLHRCRALRCKQAERDAPTTISALVDAPTRTWAVIHD